YGVALDDRVAGAGVRLRDQEVDAVDERREVEGARVDRHLLADGRRESGIEGEQELLELLLLGGVQVLEHRRGNEVEDGRDAAVVEHAEATHLLAERALAGDAELADLLVEVPEVGDLELLRLALERRQAVGAERQAAAERAGDPGGGGEGGWGEGPGPPPARRGPVCQAPVPGRSGRGGAGGNTAR